MNQESSQPMFDCPGQPGAARVTPQGCTRMYLAAHHHPQTQTWRKKGYIGVPPALRGTPLGECLTCCVGKERACLTDEVEG